MKDLYLMVPETVKEEHANRIQECVEFLDATIQQIDTLPRDVIRTNLESVQCNIKTIGNYIKEK